MNKLEILKLLLKSADNFKVNTLYWDHDLLTVEENDLRNYPAPWIKKTIEMLRIIKGTTVVEIGSTRHCLTQKCLDYYDNCHTMTPKEAPACCQDGHSTYFWANEGLETYTVDIEERCRKVLIEQYEWHLKIPMPSNLHICIEDGIQFLKSFTSKIDLLFLDGWDKGTSEYAENHLRAYEAAKDKLSDLHLISIDDTDFNTPSGGKDNLLTPRLIDEGYIKLIWGRQIVFFKL